ncbi:hypothetical protein [Erythrobacter sp. THAF29]|uniref:hypothetical protein n=1 Tax=Erythrobacter sp. THAF29 TaxID=2587851 RepID=UPI00126903F2|nr:hypothetical protein [Erythrobacter sp. THAF29]QFT76541.1 hypothetical protein FIU90_03190 [Erythrobacter sp. THAF29]
MIGIYAAMLSLAALGPATTQCGETDKSDDYHLLSVCEGFLEGGPAFSATVRASLSAKPASQQVMVFKLDGTWMVAIAGYSWSPGGAVLTRRAEFEISPEDAKAIAGLLDGETFDRLGKIKFYGRDDRICMDGAVYELAAASGGRKASARQHSCAGTTEINSIMAAFRELAIKYDPDSQGMLYWLKD